MVDLPDAAASHRLGRVLFADDDPLVRNAFARLLRARGFIVDLAADGLDALALASEYPYAIVATDHQMPGLSGMELITSIRRLQQDATFVLVTGVASVAERGAEALSVSAILEKPWEDSQLVRIVDEALREATRRQEARQVETDRPASARGQLVLLLEDSEMDAALLTRMLQHAAPNTYRIVRTEKLSDACRLLKARPYDVILADQGLPDAAGGTAVLTELQAGAPGTPIPVVA